KPHEGAAALSRDRLASPVLPRQVVPQLSTSWDAAVAGCLATPTSQRLARATQAVRLLEEESTRAPAGVRWSWRRIWVWTTALVLAMALGIAGFRLYRWRQKVPEGSTVLIADIGNATPDRELDAVTEVLRQQLAQSAYFNIWDRSLLPETLTRMKRLATEKLTADLPCEVAPRQRVPYVLFGNIGSVGDSLVLNLRLELLAPNSVLRRRSWSHSVEVAGKRALQEGIHDASSWLRRAIGETARDL